MTRASKDLACGFYILACLASGVTGLLGVAYTSGHIAATSQCTSIYLQEKFRHAATTAKVADGTTAKKADGEHSGKDTDMIALKDQ